MYLDVNIVIIILAVIFSPLFYAIRSKNKILKLEKRIQDYENGLDGIVEYKTEQYRTQRDKALQSNTYKSDYISNMATDLGNTVNCIMDFSFIGQTNVGIWPDEKHKKNYELLISNTAKISAYLSKLIDISKLEAGRMYFSFSPKTIAEVIGQSLIELEELRESRENIININEPDDFTKATFDFNSLIKVTSTFLKYIIDNSPYKSTIDISIGDTLIMEKREAKDAVYCSISCNSFLDENKVDSFDTFSSNDVDFGICREIIQTHKGKIWVEDSDNTYKICYSIPCVRHEIRELDKAA